MTAKKADIQIDTIPPIAVSDMKFEVFEDGSIMTDVTGLERITGTTLAECLGKSEWGTPFTAACKILGLYETPDNDRMRLGRYLEPKIIEHLNKNGISALSAKEIFGTDQPDDYRSWKSHFDHPIFGGHLDAMTDDGAIVEIKTTGRMDAWVNAKGEPCVPFMYHVQASLYARMMESDKIIFAVASVDADVKPSDIDLKDKIFLFEVEPLAEIDDLMDSAAEFYEEFIRNGITPAPTKGNAKDDEVMKGVRTRRDTSMQAEIDRYNAIDAEIRRIEEAYLFALDADKKALAETIKQKAEWGQALKLELPASDGSMWYLSKESRQTIDKDALESDGLLDKYAKYTESTVLRKSTKGIKKKV